MGSTVLLLGFLALFLGLLVKGADLFVENAKRIGLAFGLTPFVVGVLIVGVGTSLPELATSFAGLWAGEGGVILGNAIGSNITNILLIVGVLGALSHALRIGAMTMKHELIIFAVATSHFTAIALDGTIDRLEGILLFGTYLAYLAYQIFEGGEESTSQGTRRGGRLQRRSLRSLAAPLLLAGIGLAAVIVGARGTVMVVQHLASLWGVATTIVSLSIVALGTSLPELAVSLGAFWRGDTDVAVGNIFGSNAFNLLVAAGAPAIMVPFGVPQQDIVFPLIVLAGASFILFVSGLARSINRWEGIMFLLFYIFFVAKLFLRVS